MATTTETAPAATATAPKLTGCSPSLTVNDLQKSIDYYTRVLGFQVQEKWEMEGVLRGVGLLAGNVFLMLGQDDWQKGRDRKKGEGFRLYFDTSENVDAFAKAIKARGGTLEYEPRDESWGARTFAVTDPDGFKLTFGFELSKPK